MHRVGGEGQLVAFQFASFEELIQEFAAIAVEIAVSRNESGNVALIFHADLYELAVAQKTIHAGVGGSLYELRTLAGWGILLRESLNQPLMLIFEELHWTNQETQAFLNLLVDGIANAPVLILVKYRPEYTHQWGSKTYYMQLRLDSLGKESADEMLDALLSVSLSRSIAGEGKRGDQPCGGEGARSSRAQTPNP